MRASDSILRVANLFFWPWQLAAQTWLRLVPESLTQAINPWNTVVNINSNNSGAPETERAVLTKYSYGRQLGRLTDVVALLVKRLENPQLPFGREDEQSLAEFKELRSDIAGMKKAALERRASRIVEDLESLRRSDPVAFGKLTERLRKLLAEAAAPRLTA